VTSVNFVTKHYEQQKGGKVSLTYPFLLFVSSMQSMKVDTKSRPSLLS